jgi:3-phenylpropionate/trans-cinnamate dioxygenase ferredoxin reductase component
MSSGTVIVGAGLCGGNAAVTLREEGYRERIQLIGDEPDVPFGRPPLSKSYLRDEEDLSGWQVKPSEWYAKSDIELVKGRVVAVDASVPEVTLEGGQRVAASRLLLATGGRNRRLKLPGANLPGVLSLRTRAECDAIRQVARPGRRAVVVGMGFIGSEVAASLRQLGVKVAAVFSGRGPLARVLGDEVATVMAAIHREKGVELVSDDSAVAFVGDGHLEAVLTSGGARLECDFCVVGAGIEPSLDAVQDSDIALDDGILVDELCRTSRAGIYAAGDVANHLHPVFGRVRVEHYNNAERHGRAAARSILGGDEPYDDIHTFWSDQYEHSLEYVGHARTWDQVVVRGSLEDRAFLAFYLEGGRVRAVLGLNRGGDPELDEDGELHAAKRLVRERVRLDPSVLVDEGTDVHSLASDP